MQVRVGHDDAIDADDAIAAVLAQLSRDPVKGPPRAGLLFASIDYDHAVLNDAVQAAYPEMRLVGGTAIGTASRHAYYSDGVALLTFEDPALDYAVGVGHALSEDIPLACAAAVRDLQTKLTAQPALVIVIADGLSGDMDTVVSSLKAGFGADPPTIVGGCSGDDFRFQKTHQYADGAVLTDAVVLLGIYGPLSIGVGIGTGWRPVGATSVVTASTDSRVHEIDGIPAYTFYKNRLGDVVSEQLIEFPLAILPESDDADVYYLRTVHSSEDDGTLNAFGMVPSGATVRMTVATHDDVLQGASESINAALDGCEQPAAVFIVSCGGRQTLLGTRVAEEHRVIGACLADAGRSTVPYLFFYGYGEIATDASARTGFYNETCISLAMGVSANG